MEYKKLRTTKYLLTENDELVERANKILSDISNNDTSMYDESLNDILFDSILSRLVATDFFVKGNKIPNDLNFITIETSVNNRSLKFSIGVVHSDNVSKKLNGVIYD